MACIDHFYEAMMARSEEMKQMQGYKQEKIMPIWA